MLYQHMVNCILLPALKAIWFWLLVRWGKVLIFLVSTIWVSSAYLAIRVPYQKLLSRECLPCIYLKIFISVKCGLIDWCGNCLASNSKGHWRRNKFGWNIHWFKINYRRNKKQIIKSLTSKYIDKINVKISAKMNKYKSNN